MITSNRHMDAKSEVHVLSSVTATPAIFGQRGLPSRTTASHPNFWEQYDNSTLIYDTIWQADLQRLRVFCPKLLNFKEKTLGSRFLVNGDETHKPKLKQYRQFDVLDIGCMANPVTFELQISDTKINLPISVASPDRYKGKNVLYTKVKNDDLVWIRDWVVAHQRNHGANAVLISNNASSSYDNEELRRMLASLPGIHVADVLDAPHRHGPNPSTGDNIGRCKFQQVSCLNIVRDRFLKSARAVLICDVDELVVSRNGKSVFDLTVSSISKYQTFAGTWRFSDITQRPQRHRDHVYVDPKAECCPTKYCIVPDSYFGRMCWAVHSLENVNRRLYPISKQLRYYHLRGINTSWKYDRTEVSSRELITDEETLDFLKNTFEHDA